MELFQQFHEWLRSWYYATQSTECSIMCATPVESGGGVRKVTPKTLFSSLLLIVVAAPFNSCRYRRTRLLI